MSMSKHEIGKNNKDEWLTDPKLLAELGEFDLDPCAPIVRPWDMAKKHYTTLDGGLSKLWQGRVWCNPPYGRVTKHWTKRMAEHNHGIALIYARTETNYWFPYIWDCASALFFFHGRLTFFNVDGNPARDKKGKIQKAPAPSALIAYGKSDAKVLRAFALCSRLFDGKYVSL